MSTVEIPAPEGEDGGMMPPYSGEDAVCPKCVHGEAFTWYRPAKSRMSTEEWNGGIRRTPLPERLERECQRCGFKWDECLVHDQPGMTVQALAHALDSCFPYPVEFDRQVLELAAHELLGMLRIVARPDHPLWQYSDGRAPTASVQPQDPETSEMSGR